MASLERGIEVPARVAAELHAAPIPGLAMRTAGAELADRERHLAELAPMLGDAATRLREALSELRRRLTSSQAPRLVTCHGDFKHNQLLSSGGTPTLVDLDTVCLADPALDLGQFLAYLQLKLTGDDAFAAPGAVERLSRCFLDAYFAAAAAGPAEAAAVEERAASYAALSLVERALHSWQKFKPERVDQTLTLLEAAGL
jgi:thiamine kinase-like enzyme